MASETLFQVARLRVDPVKLRGTVHLNGEPVKGPIHVKSLARPDVLLARLDVVDDGTFELQLPRTRCTLSVSSQHQRVLEKTLDLEEDLSFERHVVRQWLDPVLVVRDERQVVGRGLKAEALILDGSVTGARPRHSRFHELRFSGYGRTAKLAHRPVLSAPGRAFFRIRVPYSGYQVLEIPMMKPVRLQPPAVLTRIRLDFGERQLEKGWVGCVCPGGTISTVGFHTGRYLDAHLPGGIQTLHATGRDAVTGRLLVSFQRVDIRHGAQNVPLELVPAGELRLEGLCGDSTDAGDTASSRLVLQVRGAATGYLVQTVIPLPVVRIPLPPGEFEVKIWRDETLRFSENITLVPDGVVVRDLRTGSLAGSGEKAPAVHHSMINLYRSRRAGYTLAEPVEACVLAEPFEFKGTIQDLAGDRNLRLGFGRYRIGIREPGGDGEWIWRELNNETLAQKRKMALPRAGQGLRLVRVVDPRSQPVSFVNSDGQTPNAAGQSWVSDRRSEPAAR